MASVTLSEYGKFVSLQNNSGSADAAAPEGGVYLFASGAIGSAKLYMQNEGGSVLDVANMSVDIDSFSALGGAGLHQTQDHFLFSDNGTEKKITFSNLQDAVFADVSGDATIAAGGALTIEAGAVETAMLANDAVDADKLASNAVVNASVVDGAIKADKLDIDGSTDIGADLVDADLMLVDDGAGGTNRKSALSRFKKYVYSAMSGDATASDSGALTIEADAVESGMLNDNVISGQTELASDGLAAADELMISDGGTLKKIGVDNLMKDAPGLLSAAAVAVADDHFMFLDGGATGDAKVESVADLMTAVAGDGLAASSGVLAVGVDDSSIELNSDALRVKAAGIATAMLANDAVDADKLASNAVVNASVASNAAIAATKLDFNVDLGGNVTFGDQANDTVTFTGHVNVAQQLTASHAKITNLDVVTLNSIAQTETTLEVADKLIVSALSASSANSDGGGLRIGGGQNSAGNASVLYDHSNTALDFNIGGTTEVRLEDGVLRPETDSDVDLGTTGARFKDAFVDSITVTGEIDGASLDISGDADIDGTLEADAITVNGATLQVVVEDHVGAMLDGTETGIAVSYDSTDNNLDFVIDAAQTAITSILATDLKIGEDDQTKIDFETADEIHFYAANAEQVYVADGVLGPQTDSDVDLGADGVAFKKLYVDDVDLNGQGRIDLDADADTSIRSAADDQIQFELGGNDRFTMTATGMAFGAGAGAGGSSLGIDGSGTFDGGLVVGASGTGAAFRAFGAAAGDEMIWSKDAAKLSFKYHDGSSQADIMTLGGSANTDFAIEVANGSANINKIKAAAFVTYSDESLKSEVTSMANTALDTVMSLEGVEFTWKDSGERDFGFIAQDVQKVVPKAVHTGGDGVQGVDYSRLTSVLVEAVKAQQVQIEELKALLKK
jgi:hypothetical protein